MVNYIKNQADFDAIMQVSSSKLVVIDFTASWCGPCRFIGPIFEQMAGEITAAEFVKVDVDEADDVAAACGISAMPTFQLYKDGKKVDELKGADEAGLRAMITKHT